MQEKKEKRGITLYDMVVVGLLASIVFVVTMFLSVKIPTPTGQTMLKLANAAILLCGILFGGWRGGLAAGIGSMFFDLTDPAYVSQAWITLIRFFLMGLICGSIAWAGGARGRKPLRNLFAAGAASLFSTVFYIGKGTLAAMLAGSAFGPAMVGQATKIVSSGINMAAGVVLAMLLAPALRRALDSARVYDRLSAHAG